ncbi:MAG: PRC-barrel domain-containing protein [Elainella sp. C42_A2020_010]|nr:PRC-barrel domain-containing protein [Elainella sp. C42_A2020_010]
MAAQSQVIRQSDLLNQLVLNRDTMEELGRVEVLWMYPQVHRVLGFICKTGFLGRQKLAFQLAQIEALGENGLLTHSSPQKTDAEKVSRLESLLDHEVWSDEGSRIGKIIDCLFDLRTGEIPYYLFVSGGWPGMVGGVYQLPPVKILSFGRQRVLVAESSLAGFEIYQPGISQKLTEVSESFKEEVVEELSSFAKKAEETTEQAKEQLQQLTGQAKERMWQLSQRFKQKAQVWNEQVKETAETLLEQAKEHSQSLAEQVKESSHTLTRQVEEQIETLTMPDPSASDQDTDLDEWDDDWFDESDEVDEPIQTNQLNKNNADKDEDKDKDEYANKIDEQDIAPLPKYDSNSVTPSRPAFTPPTTSEQNLNSTPVDNPASNPADSSTDDDDDPWI